MNDKDVSMPTKKIDEFLQEYTNAAILHGKATLVGDYKTANKQYANLTKLYRLLEKDKFLMRNPVDADQ